jgi:hypothetical protein
LGRLDDEGHDLTVAAAVEWETANQQALVAEVARVRAALERKLGEEPPGSPPPAPTDGEATALDVVVSAFGLSPFERDVLLLAAGVELDGGVAALCARAQPGVGVTAPTFSLALAALDDPHWSALSPDRPLRLWRLVSVGASASLAAAPLTIDERVLHFLAGVQTTSAGLRGIAHPIEPTPLPAGRADSARLVAACIRDGRRAELSGGDADGRRGVAAAAASALELVALELAARDLPATADERLELARLVDRESVLGGFLPVLDTGDDGAAAVALCDTLASPCVVLTRNPLREYRAPVTRVDAGALTEADRRRLLVEAGRDPADAAAAAQQFRLDSTALQAVSAQLAVGNGSLWDALRAQARPSLDDLAQRIEPAAGWDDLVLPAPILDTLRQIELQVRRRSQVYEDWGFARKSSRGLGISALFAGPSGTGKTTAAEVLAAGLRLDLYRIDLSAVVSKYIGETEKNLRRVFDAADEGGAVLLFDEADALFGKRSEVKDSHDRYANIEVSYLLQRMEAYRGLAILTTNRREALDPAFLRRLRFVVQFPFPDAAQRAEIWRRVFPAETPLGGIDAVRLAQMSVPGGTIRNIALSAAFFAADAGEPVTMGHVLQAARTEHAKIEKPLTDTEIAGWT